MAEYVYVAGPVVTPATGPPPALYTDIAREFERFGIEVALPVRHDDLDSLEPAEFTREIRTRIKHAHSVVTVLEAGDQSVPVEATLASELGKGQIVVAVDGKVPIPRLVAGLRGVRVVADSLDRALLRSSIGDLIDGGATDVT